RSRPIRKGRLSITRVPFQTFISGREDRFSTVDEKRSRGRGRQSSLFVGILSLALPPATSIRSAGRRYFLDSPGTLFALECHLLTSSRSWNRSRIDTQTLTLDHS